MSFFDNEADCLSSDSDEVEFNNLPITVEEEHERSAGIFIDEEIQDKLMDEAILRRSKRLRTRTQNVIQITEKLTQTSIPKPHREPTEGSNHESCLEQRTVLADKARERVSRNTERRSAMTVQYFPNGKRRFYEIEDIVGIEKVLFTDGKDRIERKVLVWVQIGCASTTNHQPVTKDDLDEEGFKLYCQAVEDFANETYDKVIPRRSYKRSLAENDYIETHCYLAFQPDPLSGFREVSCQDTKYRIQFLPWPVLFDQLSPKALRKARRLVGSRGQHINFIKDEHFVSPSQFSEDSWEALPTVVEKHKSLLGIFANFFEDVADNCVQYSGPIANSTEHCENIRFFNQLLKNEDLPFRHYDLSVDGIQKSEFLLNFRKDEYKKLKIERCKELSHSDVRLMFRTSMKYYYPACDFVIRTDPEKDICYDAMDVANEVEIDLEIGSSETEDHLRENITDCISSTTMIVDEPGQARGTVDEEDDVLILGDFRPANADDFDANFCTLIEVPSLTEDVEKSEECNHETVDECNSSENRRSCKEKPKKDKIMLYTKKSKLQKVSVLKETAKMFHGSCRYCIFNGKRAFSFKTRKTYRQHLKEFHGEVLKFQSCAECPPEFQLNQIAFRGTLEEHKMSYHNSAFEFSCKHCNWTFPNNGAKKTHERTTCKMIKLRALEAN